MSKLQSRVHNGEDIIDSRDIIERVNELESDLQTAHDAARREWEALTSDDHKTADEPLVEPLEDFEEWLKVQAEMDNNDHSDIDHQEDAAELLMLRALVEDIDSTAGDRARDGVGLIRDSYFEQYAQEMAEDLHGQAVRNAEWPFTCIDWERAARELQHDYSIVEFDGVDYWVRS